jgi:hypothetical protein
MEGMGSKERGGNGMGRKCYYILCSLILFVLLTSVTLQPNKISNANFFLSPFVPFSTPHPNKTRKMKTVKLMKLVVILD